MFVGNAFDLTWLRSLREPRIWENLSKLRRIKNVTVSTDFDTVKRTSVNHDTKNKVFRINWLIAVFYSAIEEEKNCIVRSYFA
jgi:hypothetical protein